MTSAENKDKENSPSRKLSSEETEVVTQRLYTQELEKRKKFEVHRQEVFAKVRAEPKHISNEDLEQHINRVYTQQIEKQKKFKEEAAARVDAGRTPPKQVTESELQEMVQRMYYQENEKRERLSASLSTKYQPNGETKKLDKDQMAESAKRLSAYDFDAREEELFQKHVASTLAPTIKISKERIKEVADRLASKK